MFDALNFPPAQLSIVSVKEKIHLQCLLRKKLLVFTPEEWVRQHVIYYLINHLNYPPGFISVEKGITINKLQRRADVIVSNRLGEPTLLIECKAASVNLNEKVFHQLAHYNSKVKASFFCITNGINHYTFKIGVENQSVVNIDKMPNWDEINQ